VTEIASTFAAGFGGGGAAAAYESVLVPRLFTPCAIALLTRLGLAPGETLLDVACGTGIVGRLAAPVLGPTGRVVGRDLTEQMVEAARAVRLPADSAPVDYGVAPADRLDVGDATVDIVACQQGLQFFPDAPAAVAEMFRVLRPGGRVGIALWRRIEECPFWAAVRVAATEHLDAERAVLITAPFAWPGQAALVDVLGGAGFVDVVVSTHSVLMHFESGMRHALTSLAATPLGPHLAALDGEAYDSFVDAATRALGLSDTPDAPVDIPARTLVGTARRLPLDSERTGRVQALAE
jgi:ubiquinone/menaquinone biosynthesis C-methylase UbiE